MLGASTTFLKRIIRHHGSEDETSLLCVEYCAAALASVLLNKSIHCKFLGKPSSCCCCWRHCANLSHCTEIGGLEEIGRIAKKSTNSRVLAAIGMIVVTMVPSPEELYVSSPLQPLYGPSWPSPSLPLSSAVALCRCLCVFHCF